MKINPFIPRQHNPFAEKKSAHRFAPPIADKLSGSQPCELPGSSRSASQFIKLTLVSTAVFLILVFFVFREIQHQRELYQMNRLIAAAEARNRQWLEQQRLEEAREAGLIAVLHNQQCQAQNLRIAKTPRNQATYVASLHHR